MPKSVDAITPRAKRAGTRTRRTSTSRPAAKRAPVAKPQPVVKVKTTAPASRSASKPIVRDIAPAVHHEERRRYLAPLVLASVTVILILWVVVQAGVARSRGEDTFFSAIAKTVSVTELRQAWDRLTNRTPTDEELLERARREIFPQFEDQSPTGRVSTTP